MAEITLYAWARPVQAGDYGFTPEMEGIDPRKLVDHTWVTSYDNRLHQYPSIGAVIENNVAYWYCWGVFHPKGQSATLPNGFLGQGPAGLPHAACLCEPNADSDHEAARGTIFTYGLDGVCHQLANQVLWATKLNGNSPQTVRLARGYWLSNAVYGTYGRLHASTWKQKKTQCQSALEAQLDSDNVDDFETHLRESLGQNLVEETVQALLDRRALLTASIAKLQSGKLTQDAPTAEQINEQAREFQRYAASLLSEEEYTRVFGVSPAEILDVVNPALFGKEIPPQNS
ncbi:hypothetical protein [Ralstonia solanacearum]|uniref:hypothetical protein n=1 Tax=Ralstonia solanacearum TaxID=305 RepID=UPI000A4464D3|nr:hypothetical protein [Ralstonia solanacearum]